MWWERIQTTPGLLYMPDTSSLPLLLCGLNRPCADQTCPALFFFLRRRPEAVTAGHFWNRTAHGDAASRPCRRRTSQKKGQKSMGRNHTPKTDIVVRIVRVVPVAVGSAQIRCIRIVPRAAAHAPGLPDRPMTGAYPCPSCPVNRVYPVLKNVRFRCAESQRASRIRDSETRGFREQS